jgi:hypothetical protein
VGLGRFDQLRDPGEAGIVEQEGKGVEADLPFTDVLVAIDPGAQRLLRVVEVKGADVGDAYVPVQVLDRSLVAVACPDVIAGGEDVAGVETDSHPAAVIDQAEHVAKFFEAASEAASLAG